MLNLRPYQEEAVNNFRDSMREHKVIEERPYQTSILDRVRAFFRKLGSKSVVVVSPTGSGKTVMFAKIAKGAASRNSRVLILVHRREILEQILKSLHELGVVSGQIASGRPQTIDSVQVAMVMSLTRRINYVKRPDLIIVDECHHALQDNSWGRILKYWRDVPRIGFTATPERLDGRGLGETFEEMIVGPSVAELVRDGWLSCPVVYRPPEEVAQNYHVKRGDFDIKEQAETMGRRKIIGDVIEHYKKHLEGLPVVCFCVSVEHSHLMAEEFRTAGYRTMPVYGDMPKTERERAIRGLADGSVQVVTSCDLISEGVDIPVMAGSILLRRTMSLALYLQQAGRSLRPSPGKNRAMILDHVGNYYLHGHILEKRQWSLNSQARDPRKEKPPATTTCPICYGVWPGTPRICPACGFKFSDIQREIKPLQMVAGELIEAVPSLAPHDAQGMAAFLSGTQKMTPDQRQKAMWGKAFEMAQDGAPDARRRLDALRQALGYRPNWTDFVWKEILKRRA